MDLRKPAKEAGVAQNDGRGQNQASWPQQGKEMSIIIQCENILLEAAGHQSEGGKQLQCASVAL